MKQTVVVNGVVAFFAVVLLYWICYRRFAALLYSSVPLLVGQAMTFAVATIVLGSLNSASASLPALLMGLGTDFTILMYARYVEERQAGASVAGATERMVGETGLGVFTGAITSAGTFYAMCVGSFRGLRDLGFLVGTGILICAVAILFLLPAMIAWNDGARKSGEGKVKKLHLQSLGLEHLIGFSVRNRRIVVVGDRRLDPRSSRAGAPAGLRCPGRFAAQQRRAVVFGPEGDRREVRGLALLHDGDRGGADRR